MSDAAVKGQPASGAAPSPYRIEPGRPGRNRTRARALAGAVAGVPAVVLLVVLALVDGPLVGLVTALVLWAVAAYVLWRRAAAVVIARLAPRPADPVAEARLHNLVESLCAGAGLAKPDLLVVDEPAPDTLALSGPGGSSHLVVTSGLLAKLTRMELEGVVAHELVHLRRGDAEVSAAVGACLLPVAAVAPTLAARLAGAALGRREGAADLGAVGLTRYPPGLVSALEKMRADTARVRSRGPALDLLWNVPPGADREDPEDSLDGRIGALLEL